MTARPFEQTVDVETPELVVLTYSLAGVGTRVLAGITDLLICMALLVGVAFAVVTLGGRPSLGGDVSASWGAAVLILAQFVVLWGYYVLFEGFMDGQTPGKRLHRLRVVREGGYSVTFGVSAARNLVRMLDMQPGVFYLVGLTSLFFTRRGRRLGDLVAGTIVVREGVGALAARPARDTRATPAPTPFFNLDKAPAELCYNRFQTISFVLPKNYVTSHRHLTNSREMGLSPVWHLLSGKFGTTLRRRR